MLAVSGSRLGLPRRGQPNIATNSCNLDISGRYSTRPKKRDDTCQTEPHSISLVAAGAARDFDDTETLPALLAESADSGEEVTTTLGRQVRRSVELLVSALSEANRERHNELLDEVTHQEVYRGAVTVMMRLVFLLSAEERGLLLLGDDTYDAHYAVSTLDLSSSSECQRGCDRVVPDGPRRSAAGVGVSWRGGLYWER